MLISLLLNTQGTFWGLFLRHFLPTTIYYFAFIYAFTINTYKIRTLSLFLIGLHIFYQLYRSTSVKIDVIFTACMTTSKNKEYQLS